MVLVGVVFAVGSVSAGGRSEVGGGAGQPAGEIQIARPWARATTNAGGNTGAYMRIGNPTAEADRLVEARWDGARKVELHTHLMEDGMARMRQVADIPLPPNEIVELAPGGLHVMLMGVTEALKEGDSFVLTLVFERAGEVEIEVPVRGMTGGHSGN